MTVKMCEYLIKQHGEAWVKEHATMLKSQQYVETLL